MTIKYLIISGSKNKNWISLGQIGGG